jgi:unsaturated chondroitin disaccharide hydrolase
MERTAAGGVPPNDWDEPSPKYPFESSAAAIAACGFLELSELEADPGMSEQHRRYALQILDSLTGPEFLAFESPGWEGILKHGIYHIGKGLGVDESVAWGDYFFLEALERVLNHDRIR